MTIKAIETKAFGCRFRSRLEARWAVFFTELGCCWEYEPQGFTLEHSGTYLPDFLVHDFPHYQDTIWVEVKENNPTQNELNKLRELCCSTGYFGYFAINNPVTCTGTKLASPFRRVIDTVHDTYDPYKISWPLTHGQVPHSTFHALGQWGLGDRRSPEGKQFFEELDSLLDQMFNEPPAADFYFPAVAALSARFEHGEAPLGVR